MTKEEWYRQLFEHLSASKFRSSFHLKQKDIAYIKEKGLDVIREHARDFIAKREAPAVIPNDGKQTPMRGHPVFVAQHATATCCRECIRKWHNLRYCTFTISAGAVFFSGSEKYPRLCIRRTWRNGICSVVPGNAGNQTHSGTL